VFTRVTALSSALYTLDVRGQTSMSGDVVTFQSALNALPECESVLVEEQETRGGTTFFRFKITFKTGSLKAADQS
nr:hypothetical protein [Opitutaceae bacterium]